MPSLADEVPKAPVGTIFVKATQGGFAVPPRKFTVYFGRAMLDVHVPVGGKDQYVSRLHGVFTCDGTQWWLRNEGGLPIQMLGEEPLLRGHEMPMRTGYTPLTIETPRRRSHWIEVHLIGSSLTGKDADSQASTIRSDVYDLSPPERLVITALAQRYLLQERYPQPVAWKQVADDMSRADPAAELDPSVSSTPSPGSASVCRAADARSRGCCVRTGSVSPWGTRSTTI
jgi:hypothetical protein